MGEARHLWTADYDSGMAYLQVEGLFARVLSEWNVEQDYVGDHHGTRMRHIFCAQSVGTQKSANAALFRGFRAYQNSRPEGDKHPTVKGSIFMRITSPSWFISNPLNVVSLQNTFHTECKIITVRSKGDFFRKFEASAPLSTYIPDNGPVQDQRINLIVNLAAGKNFRHRNPEVDLIRAAGRMMSDRLGQKTCTTGSMASSSEPLVMTWYGKGPRFAAGKLVRGCTSTEKPCRRSNTTRRQS